MFQPVYRFLSSLLLKRKLHLTRGLAYLGRDTLIPLNKLDYVRVGTLELLAAEICEKNVPGSVAELGVYKGGFAKYLNQVFPDRPLYLFDTFEGFDAGDIKKESLMGFEPGSQDFSNTSVSYVLSQMKHPEKCIIRKGVFPASYDGISNEKFCFVSIDADLYEPVYNGLELFYRDLSPNGSIMVHDYNNAEYRGCKKAVQDFCGKNHVSYVPIPDIGGSVVIRKWD